jgi:spermidine/putrescine transport system permease protein
VIPALEPRVSPLRAALLTAFLLFLFAPLAVVAVFAFNDAAYPAPPWRGFVLDWFLGNADRGRVGLLQDGPLLSSIGTSCIVAFWVALVSVGLGTAGAMLLERHQFRGKGLLGLMLLVPLVIPGVILGVSILSFASRIAEMADEFLGMDLDFLRPGLPLVVCGQVSFMAAIATLTIAARLKRLDPGLEEAALDLGATRWTAFTTIVLPFLRPAMIGSAVIAFLMSFENFNTTLLLTGSDPPLTVFLYGRMREGATPVVNAVSLLLMVASAIAAIATRRKSGSA